MINKDVEEYELEMMRMMTKVEQLKVFKGDGSTSESIQAEAQKNIEAIKSAQTKALVETLKNNKISYRIFELKTTIFDNYEKQLTVLYILALWQLFRSVS